MIILFTQLILFYILILLIYLNLKKKNVLLISKNIHFIRFYIQQNCIKENIDVQKNIDIIQNLHYCLYSSENRNNIMLIPKNDIYYKKYHKIVKNIDIKDFDFLKYSNNSMHPNVFLINLEKCRERLEFMKFKLKNINLSVRLVYGIDGYKHNYNISSTNKSLGAYGLLLTYEKLLRYAIEKNLDEILILEDDIYFHKNFNSLFLKYKYLMKDKDIVYLGTSQSEFPNIYNHFYEMNDKIYTYGTYGIILKKKFIIILYHALRNKDIDIDVLINHLYRKNKFDLNTIIFYPPLILPEVRDSLNMGKRKLNEFLKKRNLFQFKNQFSHINHYFNFNHKNNLHTKKQNKFCFIIPSYNNELWIEKNIKSILLQNYTNYHIYYTNDLSNDNTLHILNKLIKIYNLHNKITVYNNSNRIYQGLSRYQMYQNNNILDDDILILLDGDDFLYHSNVLNILNNIYQKGYEMTYGQFLYWTKEEGLGNIGGNKSFPKDIIHNKAYRNYPFITQHLRTMKKKIIKDIDKNNFYDWNNNIINSCTDLIESFHCLEKTDKHINSEHILLVYNKTNSIKHSNSYYRNENREYKLKVEKFIRNNFNFYDF